MEGNKTHDSSNIIIFPDFEKLKSEVEKLRIELSMLVLEKDELLFVECKNIETGEVLVWSDLSIHLIEDLQYMFSLNIFKPLSGHPVFNRQVKGQVHCFYGIIL